MDKLRKDLQQAIGWLYSQVPGLAREWGKSFDALSFDNVPFTRLHKPLNQVKLALITTGGVHLVDQPPFNMADSTGDPTFRAIPPATPREQITITHDYYDHRDAEADLNILFPMQLLSELVAAGHIGGLATSYGFMGHIEPPHVATLLRDTAPAVAEMLKQEQVDAVLLTPA